MPPTTEDDDDDEVPQQQRQQTTTVGADDDYNANNNNNNRNNHNDKTPTTVDDNNDDYYYYGKQHNTTNDKDDHRQHEHDDHHQQQQQHEHDDEEHHNDEHHAASSSAAAGPIPSFTTPRQRQRWGDTQKHPHTNWGDIFFDLFYVAAAYNLGNVLRESPTRTGLLYTLGLFFPIQNIWTFKMYYDSRFYVHDDYFHKLYELALLFALATSVLYIRPVSILANAQNNNDMFLFCLGISISNILACGRYIEIIICQKFLYANEEGHDGNTKTKLGLYPEAAVAGMRDLIMNLGPTILFMSAAIYSGIEYYSHQNNDSDEKYGGSSDGQRYENGNKNATVDDVDDHAKMRWMAETSDNNYDSSDEENNLPIWLLLGGTFVAVALFLCRILYYSKFNNKGHHQKSSVPMNVDFVIHRYGEWIMLMLGETVLSLLIVDIVETSGYYQTFVSGIISIVLLEYLHFQSQPSDPDQHAIRRSLWSSFIFYWFMQIYSMALIILGTSYKMLLYEQVYMLQYDDDDEEDGYHRGFRNLFRSNWDNRWLAGGESAALQYTPEKRQEWIAHFFCGSLALVFFCIDVMSVAHKGISANVERCECTASKFKKMLAIGNILLHVVLLFFIATISQWNTNPDNLATIGLSMIVLQLCLRGLGSYIFDKSSKDDAEEQAIDRIINYNMARMTSTGNDRE